MIRPLGRVAGGANSGYHGQRRSKNKKKNKRPRERERETDRAVVGCASCCCSVDGGGVAEWRGRAAMEEMAVAAGARWWSEEKVASVLS